MHLIAFKHGNSNSLIKNKSKSLYSVYRFTLGEISQGKHDKNPYIKLQKKNLII